MTSHIEHPQQLKTTLDSGQIQLSIQQQINWFAEDLFEIAQRHNPKRAFLFVSKVLGRHIPQYPHVIRQAFTDLANHIPLTLPGPILIMGMAETAIGLAAGIHQVYSEKHPKSPPLFLTTTRHRLNDHLLCRFEEEHSHASHHLVHLPNTAELQDQLYATKTLIMVDDEATTGKTFVNLFNALTQNGLTHINNVITLTLTDWSDNSTQSQIPCSITNYSLLSGQWQWLPTAQSPTSQLPCYDRPIKFLQPLSSHAAQWGRLGLTQHHHDLHVQTACVGEKILVLGSGEHVWQPFLLAESLEKQGAIVKFSATTRSPISLGYAIKKSYSFADNYGLNIPMYLYNVDPSEYDRVILCSETAITSWDHTFLSHFPHLEFIG